MAGPFCVQCAHHNREMMAGEEADVCLAAISVVTGRHVPKRCEGQRLPQGSCGREGGRFVARQTASVEAPLNCATRYTIARAALEDLLDAQIAHGCHGPAYVARAVQIMRWIGPHLEGVLRAALPTLERQAQEERRVHAEQRRTTQTE